MTFETLLNRAIKQELQWILLLRPNYFIGTRSQLGYKSVFSYPPTGLHITTTLRLWYELALSADPIAVVAATVFLEQHDDHNYLCHKLAYGLQESLKDHPIHGGKWSEREFRNPVEDS